MTRPVVVTCALTGAGDTTGVSPHVPITPEQLISEALAAQAAGAAIVHIHVRDPATGQPSMDLTLYRQVTEGIRAAKTDVLINLTTGVGGSFLPDDDDPNRNAIQGMVKPDKRMAHIVALKPDICSLDVATMNFGSQAFINVPAHLERMATAMRENGVQPELEVFDLGHVRLARHMHDRGFFTDPAWLQLCLGVPWGAPASAEAMLAMRALLPPGSNWSAFGISRHQFPMVAQAVILGGHVRVGLEDNLYLRHGELSPGNAPLVARAVRIIEELGEHAASPAEARTILGLNR